MKRGVVHYDFVLKKIYSTAMFIWRYVKHVLGCEFMCLLFYIIYTCLVTIRIFSFCMFPTKLLSLTIGATTVQ